MPTKRIGGFLCYFVSYDCIEPPHIHLAKGKGRSASSVKFWLHPLELAVNKGLSGGELRTAWQIVEQNQNLLPEMWDDHCND